MLPTNSIISPVLNLSIFVKKTMASSHCFSLLCLALLMAMAAGARFRVGGPTGWAVPTDPSATSFNQWAEKIPFRIGDSILFVYPPDRDSVVQVNQDAYNTCNTSDYIQRFDDGNTVFTFNRSGPYYFISGHENNCLRNESMAVMVVADQSNRNSSGPSVRPDTPLYPPPTAPLPLSPPSPPPSPVEVPPPPAEEATPPTSPLEVPPPPPPAEVTSPPAPTGEESSPPPPSPNAGALKVVGFMSSVGTLLGSLLIML